MNPPPPLRRFEDALYAPPAAPDAVAAIERALGLPPPEPLAAFLTEADGAAFMEPGHRFVARFPDGEVTAILQWLYGAAEIAAQTALWRAPTAWSGDGAPCLPHRMIVIGAAVDDFDQGVLLSDLRDEAVLPGAVIYRRVGFDPALAEGGMAMGWGYVAPDLRAFLEFLGPG